MDFRKFLCVSLCFIFIGICFTGNSLAQERERLVVTIGESRPAQNPNTNRRPPLTNQIVIQKQPLVKKTGSSLPTNPIPTSAVSRKIFTPSLTQNMLQSIQGLYGKPYRYGSTGPYSYDCSGFVLAGFPKCGN